MTDLTKSLLEAISVIANKTVEEASSDMTIKVIIKKIISASEGKYLVNYNDGDFYAYSQSGSKDIYEINEQVYLLIPEGDMSQKKFIIGKVENEKDYTSSKVLSSPLLNDYVFIGDNAVIEKEYSMEELETGIAFDTRLDVIKMQPLQLNSHKVRDFYYCYLRDPSNVKDLDSRYDTVEYRILEVNEEAFINSAKQSEALLIRAKFKANIDINNIGNYGLIVNIAFSDKTNPQKDSNGNTIYPPKLIAYILDTSKMTGNPMQFFDYISQYMVASFDGENYLYIDSIIAFSEGFVDEDVKPVTHQPLSEIVEDIEDEDDEIIGDSGEEFYDDVYIYIDDIEIIGLNELSATNGDYKLRLVTPKGNTIRAGLKNDLQINASMTYLDRDITKNTTFYWGMKDLSVTSTDDNYHAKLGAGYKWFKDISGSEIILTPSNLTAAENVFVCTAVYESSIILKTTVILYNNNNKINITIDSDQGIEFQFNEGTPTLTCMINGKTKNYQLDYNDEAFSFVWTKEDSDYGTIVLDKNENLLIAERETEIKECMESENGLSQAGRSILEISSYYSTRIAQVQNISYPQGVHGPKITCTLKNTSDYVTYSCSVYRSGVYIGSASITLYNYKRIVNDNYYITITNGTQVFQYDEVGNSPTSPKKQNPIQIFDLIAVFHSPQGDEVTPKRVRWLMPKEQTLINIPSLGLSTDEETGEKYFEGDIFPLTIKDTYDSAYNDNQITVIVTHMDGREYRQSTNLLFTKIGEIGTNGTETVVKINELITPPEDERLTIIKSNDEVFYNQKDAAGQYTNIGAPVLEASLYTNNFRTLGHTTKWTIDNKTASRNYEVIYDLDDNDNICRINYNDNSIANLLDTRIIKAQTSLKGKYFYSFYGMPCIEYQEGYTYEQYPIKIIKDGTLNSILYDSSGTHPVYNENQGVQIELPEEAISDYLEWSVESGNETKVNNVITYESPNLFLSKNPKSKVGIKQINAIDEITDKENIVLNVQNVGYNCAENAAGDIKKYINEFLTDVEKIAIDNLLSISTKIEQLKKRIISFKNNSPDKKDVNIQIVYDRYWEFFEEIENEWISTRSENEWYTKLYNNVQDIWRDEWPSVINESRINVKDFTLNTIQKLVKRYQDAYDDRSNEDNDRISLPDRNIFTDSFRQLLDGQNEIISNIDSCYEKYCNDNNINNNNFDPILIEYAKVLITYILLLVEETKASFFECDNTDISDNIKTEYNFINNDWDRINSANVIGQNIYEIIYNSEDAAAGIYNNVHNLYQYYQTLYTEVQKYQVLEESDYLNIWMAILNGQSPNLLKKIYIIPNESFNGLYLNNNIVGTLYRQNENSVDCIAKIYVPIIMTLNTYELAALNGWDGTTVDVGEDHIMTPQIGAGVKNDNTNTFTGMVMGVVGTTNEKTDNFNDKINKTKKVGLIGYVDGKQSVFIDSKTGRAYFGLPEDDINTQGEENDSNATIGTNEGRIELIPGGISKIGNWKIGSRFLYNIVDGNYEKRKDIFSRSGVNNVKYMIPSDKSGIILSSNQPYIHIKGKTFEDKNLLDIDYNDEYNNINPGDSLELRLDPGNKSLFSIIQHTAGFGDEENSDLLFGYKIEGSIDENQDEVSIYTVVKDYEKNKNCFGNNNEEIPQNKNGAEYYIYKLKKDTSEKYIPYYQEENIELIKENWKENSENSKTDSIKIKKDDEDSFNFRSLFTINNEDQTVYYEPYPSDGNKLSINSAENWTSITKNTLFYEDTFNIDLNYKQEKSYTLTYYSIGKIKVPSSVSKIHEIFLKYSLNIEEEQKTTIDVFNSYIQFYITDTSDNTQLISEWTEFSKNLNSLRLFSYNNRFLVSNSNSEYTLRYRLNVNCTIEENYSCEVKKNVSNTQKLKINPYSTIDINIEEEQSEEEQSFSVRGTKEKEINGKYSFIKDENEESKGRFKIKLNNASDNASDKKEYDVIIWNSKQPNTLAYVGRIYDDKNNSPYMNFIDENDIDYTGYIDLVPINDWHVSFYPKETFISEIVVGETGSDQINNNDVVIKTGNCQTSETTVRKDVAISNYSSLVDNARVLVTFTNKNTTSAPTLKVGSCSAKPIKSYDGQNLSEDEYKWASGAQILFRYDSTRGYWLIDENVEDSQIITNGWNESSVYLFTESISSLLVKDQSINNISFTDPSFESKWKIKVSVDKNEEIKGFSFINIDQDILNVKDINIDNNNLQGERLAVTYWDENNNQRIRLYSTYYQYVNNFQKQYGYIDINNYNDIYYKYIKTLKNIKINEWFKKNSNVDKHSDSTIFVGSSNSIEIYKWIDIPERQYKSIINWKEFIRVGLDENGRFYNAGLQDKQTYLRTGKITAFGKVPNLYGQEIKVLSRNNFTSILKIFSKMSNNSIEDTTYITRNLQNLNNKDEGNISIRTAGKNHYLEFGISPISSNKNNTIPEIDNFIRISYNQGIQIKATKYNNKQEIINSGIVNLDGQKLTMNVPEIDMISLDKNNLNEDIYLENSKFTIIKDLFWAKTNTAAFSSVLSTTVDSQLEESSDYRILAKKQNNDNTKIILQVGPGVIIPDNINNRPSGSGIGIKNNNIYVTANQKILISKSKEKNYIDLGVKNIDICVDQTKISLNGVNSKNNNLIMSINNTNISMFPGNINISSNDKGSKIIMKDEVIVIQGKNDGQKSKALLVKGYTTFNNRMHLLGDIYIGWDSIEKNKKSETNSIYLCKDKDRRYVRLNGADLDQIYDWYETKRWAIGYTKENHTLWLTSVDPNQPNPNGTFKDKKYTWKIKHLGNNYVGQYRV